jgi:hypothetical protein
LTISLVAKFAAAHTGKDEENEGSKAKENKEVKEVPVATAEPVTE